MYDMKKIHETILWVLFICIYMIFIVLCFFRYEKYVSAGGVDINVHIQRALAGGGYSLNSVIYRYIHHLSTALNGNEGLIFSVYNASLPVLTVPAAAVFLKYFIGTVENTKIPTIHALWLSFTSLFVGFILFTIEI